MPLHDHFHPPLSLRRHWRAFHHAWATYLSAQINQRLPAGYFAEPNVKFGVEIDVAAFDEQFNGGTPVGSDAAWQPAPPLLVLPFTPATDVAEVAVFQESGGPTLAGAIELVSPANKDRPDSRDAFVAKCAAYLHEGVGLLIVDVVTERRANMHDALLARVSPDASPWTVPLYAVSYHPAAAADQTVLQMWPIEMHLGAALPTMTLWLRGGLCLPVDLEAAYVRTVREQRLPTESA